MREHLYRAKTKSTSIWVEGGYLKHYNRMICPIGDYLTSKDINHYIIMSGFADWNMPRQIEFHEIDPETLSQYTEKDAENGKIFENDILGFMGVDYYTEQERYYEGVVLFKDGSWRVSIIDEDNEDTHAKYKSLNSTFSYGHVCIVGNSIDTPERLDPEFFDEKTPALLEKWGVILD